MISKLVKWCDSLNFLWLWQNDQPEPEPGLEPSCVENARLLWQECLESPCTFTMDVQNIVPFGKTHQYTVDFLYSPWLFTLCVHLLRLLSIYFTRTSCYTEVCAFTVKDFSYYTVECKAMFISETFGADREVELQVYIRYV